MVHDAVKAVGTAGHFWPNYHCCVSCDVLDGYSHQDVSQVFYSLPMPISLWEGKMFVLQGGNVEAAALGMLCGL